MFSFNIRTTKSPDYEYVRITDSKIMPCDSVEQIKETEALLNNYAKSNNVRISILDPRYSKKFQKYVPDSDLAACIGISVTDKKNTKSVKYDVIDYFTDTKTPITKRVFSSVQKLITGDGTLPIERQRKEVITKLIKMGKLTA